MPDAEIERPVHWGGGWRVERLHNKRPICHYCLSLCRTGAGTFLSLVTSPLCLGMSVQVALKNPAPLLILEQGKFSRLKRLQIHLLTSPLCSDNIIKYSNRIIGVNIPPTGLATWHSDNRVKCKMRWILLTAAVLNALCCDRDSGTCPWRHWRMERRKSQEHKIVWKMIPNQTISLTLDLTTLHCHCQVDWDYIKEYNHYLEASFYTQVFYFE